MVELTHLWACKVTATFKKWAPDLIHIGLVTWYITLKRLLGDTHLLMVLATYKSYVFNFLFQVDLFWGVRRFNWAGSVMIFKTLQLFSYTCLQMEESPKQLTSDLGRDWRYCDLLT